jgi:hypothetical protein
VRNQTIHWSPSSVDAAVCLKLQRSYGMDAIVAELQGTLQCKQLHQLCPHPLILAAAVAAPHFLYAFIWFKPQVWMRLFPKNAVDAFATCGLLGKGTRPLRMLQQQQQQRLLLAAAAGSAAAEVEGGTKPKLMAWL